MILEIVVLSASLAAILVIVMEAIGLIRGT